MTNGWIAFRLLPVLPGRVLCFIKVLPAQKLSTAESYDALVIRMVRKGIGHFGEERGTEASIFPSRELVNGIELERNAWKLVRIRRACEL